jgi:hypothetical protein
MDRGKNRDSAYGPSSTNFYKGIRCISLSDMDLPGFILSDAAIINRSAFSTTNYRSDCNPMNVNPEEGGTLWTNKQHASRKAQSSPRLARLSHDSSLRPRYNTHLSLGFTNPTFITAVCKSDAFGRFVPWEFFYFHETTRDVAGGYDLKQANIWAQRGIPKSVTEHKKCKQPNGGEWK